MTETLHIEIARRSASTLKRKEILDLVRRSVESLENPVQDFCIHNDTNHHLIEHVEYISFSSYITTWKMCVADEKDIPSEKKSHTILSAIPTPYDKVEYHLYKLSDDEDEITLEEHPSEEDQQQPASNCWLLPSRKFQEKWDTVKCENDIKIRLMDFIRTLSLYADKRVNDNLISWNKVILLHGPAGTGKTTLCKALANKATIRHGSRFDYGQLIEINSHNVFSKYFSEGGKLIQKLFDKIQDLIEDHRSLTFILIDEIESLASSRYSPETRFEPADSIRVVNCLLTQIDKLKRHSNVVILTTSNIVGSIDSAFIDRADIKLFIGYPTVNLIYEIYAGSLNELIRVGIIKVDDGFLLMPPTTQAIRSSEKNYDAAQKLLEIAKSSINLSGRTLKRIPFLTHVNFVKDEICTIDSYLNVMHKTVTIEKSGAHNIQNNITPECQIENSSRKERSKLRTETAIEKARQEVSTLSVRTTRPRSNSRSVSGEVVTNTKQSSSRRRGRRSSRGSRSRRHHHGSSTRTMQKSRELESELEDTVNNGIKLRNTKVVNPSSNNEMEHEEIVNPPSPKKPKLNEDSPDRSLNQFPSLKKIKNVLAASVNQFISSKSSSSSVVGVSTVTTSSTASVVAAAAEGYNEDRLKKLYSLKSLYVDLSRSTCNSDKILIPCNKKRKSKHKSSRIKVVQVESIDNKVSQESISPLEEKSISHENSALSTLQIKSSESKASSSDNNCNNKVNGTKKSEPASTVSSSRPSPSNGPMIKLPTKPTNDLIPPTSKSNVPLNPAQESKLSIKTIRTESSKTPTGISHNKMSSTISSVTKSSSTLPLPASVDKNPNTLILKIKKPISPQQEQPVKIVAKPTSLSSKPANISVSKSSKKSNDSTSKSSGNSSSLIAENKLKQEKFDSKTSNSSSLIKIKLEKTLETNNNTHAAGEHNSTPKRSHSNDIRSKTMVVGPNEHTISNTNNKPTECIAISNKNNSNSNGIKTGELLTTISNRKQEFSNNSLVKTIQKHSKVSLKEYPVESAHKNIESTIQSKKPENNNPIPIKNGLNGSLIKGIQYDIRKVMKANPEPPKSTSITNSSEPGTVTLFTDGGEHGGKKRKETDDPGEPKIAEMKTTVLPPTNGKLSPHPHTGIVQNKHMGKPQLTNPQLSHQNLNKPTCVQCKKSFVSEKNLNRHKAKCKNKVFPTPTPSPIPGEKVHNGIVTHHSQKLLNPDHATSNDKLAIVSDKIGATSMSMSNSKSRTLNSQNTPALTSRPSSCINSSQHPLISSLVGKARHELVHNDSRPFACSQCYKSYKTEDSLNFHVEHDHKLPQDLISCSICGQLFKSAEEVEEHEKTQHINDSSDSNSPSPTESDMFPETPFSQATTELSSVSSFHNSECDSATIYNESPQQFSHSAPGSSQLLEEFEFSGSFQRSLLGNNNNIINNNNTSSLEHMDFSMEYNYQNCNICGECFIGAYELNQHFQMLHANPQAPNQTHLVPQYPSHDSEQLYLNVPVHGVENGIEIETTDEFLKFLNTI